MSDGARTNELRRASDGEIGNEQIWQAYELGDEKAEDMLKDLGESLKSAGFASDDPHFNLIWLLDDFGQRQYLFGTTAHRARSRGNCRRSTNGFTREAWWIRRTTRCF